MCLTGAVRSIQVSSTDEVGRFKPFYCSDKYFCHWIQRIQWEHLGKTPLLRQPDYFVLLELTSANANSPIGILNWFIKTGS